MLGWEAGSQTQYKLYDILNPCINPDYLGQIAIYLVSLDRKDTKSRQLSMENPQWNDDGSLIDNSRK